MKTSNDLIGFFLSLIGKGKRFETKQALADFLGLGRTTRTTLFNFLEGTKTQYSYVLAWFLQVGGQIAFPDERITEYAFVQREKAVAGAGESFETDEGADGLYAFRKDFMEKIHVKEENARLMRVCGDSMLPLIHDGDNVLFNTMDREPRDGRIYVCSFGDALMVKRLQQIPHGWQLCSENARYSPVQVMGDELELLRIHGRVLWSGHVFT